MQLQPSPTTGKVPFVPNGSNRSSVLVSDGPDRSKENSRLEDNDSSPFALKPVAEVTPSFFSSEPKVRCFCFKFFGPRKESIPECFQILNAVVYLL